MTDAVTAPIVLASGGTGGHMFPAAALAGELLARGFVTALVSDRRGMDYRALPAGVETYEVASASPSGGALRKVAALFALLRGTLEARRLLGGLRPAAVVGFGGYASVPALTAAVLDRRPIVLHEQNAVLGRANRLWAGRARAIAVSFDKVESIPPKARTRAEIRLTGNPIRAEIAALADRDYDAPRPDGPLRLLVLGGSQGATVFSEVVPAAVARLAESLRGRLRIEQQCRPEDLDRVRAAYAALGMAPLLATFFDDVPARLAACHMVISRSGASTVAELTAAGRPALLVPYKYAMDDHQTWNARALEAAGAASVAAQDAFTPEFLAGWLRARLGDPAPLAEAAARSRALGHGDAAARLADLVLSVIGTNAGGRA